MPVHLFGGVYVITSPLTSAVPCFTLPSMIRNESPSTSEILVASVI